MEPDENGTCLDIYTYMCHDKGMLMPFVNEYTWPRAGRGTIYFLGLLWSFLGVAIIADTFMCSIEKITSKTRTIKVANQDNEKGYEEIEVKVWNDTVANLTLMALGSSAPEILLSIIEICGNNFKAGALGPSTIVGSAAFNLLVITGICVISIKDPDTRVIKHVKVFAVTAVFSIFAYVWLIIILVLVTENYVDLWEAILTLLFFPILVILAYIADKDFCSKKPTTGEDGTELELGFGRRKGEYKVSDGNEEEKQSLYHPDGRIDDDAMRKFIKELKRQHHDLSEEEVCKLASARMQDDQPHDRLWYRINATRKLGGSYKLTPSMNEQLHEIYESMKDRAPAVDPSNIQHHGSTADMSEGSTRSVVEFTASKSSIMEREGHVKVGLRRYGKLNCRVLVRFETIDGTAEAEKDYVPKKETIVFEKDETYKSVDIEIIDDNEWEPDEVFFAKINMNQLDQANDNCIIGKRAIMEITIINDDEPGTFEFSKPSLLFKESAGKALIPVERRNGADGQVTLKWKTEDMTATAGHDYEGGEGTLVFEHGETTKTLDIAIYDDQEVEKDETFKVTLTECCTEGAKLGTISKTIITIVNDDDFNGMVSRLVLMTNMNVDALRMDTTTYQDQFRNAMNVNGGDLDGATHMDYIMHFLTFGWKIIFAIVPPPSIAGGWLAFVVALGMLAILTTLIGDLAGIFGCLVGLEDSITAITFVALGTSLPDLFASKQAAQNEKTADACIGNVTGSNSVNVFLGLGLPWVISAIYWGTKGESFYVPAGSLSFSVACYTVAAIICLGFIVLRRFLPVFGKAELGGPRGPAIGCCVFFIILWVMYILLSSLEAVGHIKANL